MKKFSITKDEINYLEDMIIYLAEEGNSLSVEGSKLFKEVIDRVNSRPILDTMIDPSVLENTHEGEVITND